MPTSRLLRALAYSTLSMAGVLALGGGCGQTEHSDYLPAPTTGGSGGAHGQVDGSAGDTGAVSCIEGRVERCQVDLPPQGHIQGCFDGWHLCTSAGWGDCLTWDDLGLGGAAGAPGVGTAGAPGAGTAGASGAG